MACSRIACGDDGYDDGYDNGIHHDHGSDVDADDDGRDCYDEDDRVIVLINSWRLRMACSRIACECD
jgi:hypothetical protein